MTGVDSRESGDWSEWVPTSRLGSSAEDRVALWLSESNVPFKVQRQFPGLVGVCGKPLRFDFSIWIHGYPEILLEYQGPYHDFLGEHNMGVIGYEHDRRKQRYALWSGLPLIYLYIGLPPELERQVLMEWIDWQKMLWNQRRERVDMLREDGGCYDGVRTREPYTTGNSINTARRALLFDLRQEHDVVDYEIRQLRIFIGRLRATKHALQQSKVFLRGVGALNSPASSGVCHDGSESSEIPGTVLQPVAVVDDARGVLPVVLRKRKASTINIIC